MMEEQLIEINKKISQIEGILSKRKQRVTEWNTHYKKILEDKQDKSVYMSKSFNSLGFYQGQKPQSKQQVKKALENHLQETRNKIKNHYNQLKELDMLQKQRNKIRAVILQERERQKKQKQNIFEGHTKQNLQNREKQKQKPEFLRKENFSRTVKERVNPFGNARADKFVEIFNQSRNNEELVGQKLMKYFGVGVESTPLGVNLKRDESKGENKIKKEKGECRVNANKCNFPKSFSQAFKENQRIFGNNRSPNLFEDRIRKIIKYHGDFWNEEFEIR